MAARKKKNLVIVESPAKARTINKYLGPDYEVVACKGHVRDLPKSKFGIEIEGGWKPTYVPLKEKGKKELIDALKKQAAKAGTVFLAPDPDREGEAIAWHLKEVLGLDDEKIRRVTFNEITRSAVLKAFAHATDIDMDRVQAQEARRFLDRVVGYQLSPLLSNTLAQTLSAGRVQSVAVRLIVDREREIEAFKPEEYWKVTATVAPEGTAKNTALVKASVTKYKPPRRKKAEDGAESADGEAPAAPAPELPAGAFLAELAEWDGKKFKASKEDEAKAVLKALEGAAYTVGKVEQKDRQERPSPPFTTSTLQQQASIRLHYSAKKTMMTAQRLYEGLELTGEGSVALITYMRTDSTRVSGEALTACREMIERDYGKPYLPEKANVYASGKSAQEAHEAVRPTDVAYTPKRVAELLPQKTEHRHELLRLYDLIWRRFVASQMTPAVFAVTNVEVTAAKGVFKAQGKIMKFDGYRKVLPPGGKQADVLLPALAEKQALDLLGLAATQHFTEPPSRYNEASLVKTLEKEGIGRPSTYAAIISKIKERNYVELKERRFYATPIGMQVTDLLVKHFPRVMDLKFTSHMEEEFDEVETGKLKRNDVLDEFYNPFNEAVTEAKKEMMADAEKCPKCGLPLMERFGKFGKFFGCSGYKKDGTGCDYIKKRTAGEGEQEGPKETEHKCPNCGKMMVQRMGRRGTFLGCSGYPECKTTMNLDAEGKPVLSALPTQHACEKCGKPMVIRQGPRGPFLACTGYPKCRNSKDVDAEGNPVKPIETGETCEKCGAPMIVRKGPRGPFMGCSKYPECRSYKKLPEELKEKVAALMPARPKVPKVAVSETCPECGGSMEVRQGRRGPFLGCTNYKATKCKGTREASPELLEQIQQATTA